ncbi:hypothetical protein RT723_01660 [Psychrosphaera aquimarina]|uniref:RiboL-PSP-HEPN domain-containing protein n=1 Tax=Psychrosphaera aquimarina TaxID=2044854 RepID=A0ABU3QWD5_9GAMM|nr:hypothetical protein [Psychrosphaera aquimarina]MDU0111736.1 hypothetical protein [Psychrosphaera aquimarina]
MSPSKVITISILLFILCSAISGYIGYINPIWILNENQILYLFSTSAQVLAGVYGLTLTGFIFFRNELSREEFDDDSLTDAVEALKERYFKLLVFITLFSVFTLLISNFVISIESSKNSNMGTFFINVGQASFVINLLVITYFIFDVIAPKRIERASKNLQETFDPVSSTEEKGSLEEFLTNFNQIEYILQKYGQAFQSEMSGFQPKSRRRISNVKLAQIILQAERIDNGLFDEIKRLITLRNSIVHGEEPIVSLKMVTASRSILVGLSNALGVHVPEN